MLTKQRKSNIMYALLAMLFSLVLFFNANGSNLQSTLTATNAYEETLTEVPITINYDSDNYFIQGFEPTVTVKLSSVNRIQLNAEKNEETRNFSIVADLTNLEEGTHDVPLEIKNMSNSVTATIVPKIFTVTIEKKVSQTFPVEIDFSENNLQENFTLDKITLEPNEVTITTGDQTMQEIAKVYANADTLQDISSTTEKTVEVYAVTKDGDILTTQIDPETVNVRIEVSAPEKDVSLYINQYGVVPANISYFDYELSQTQAKVIGEQSLLDTINSIGIPVDITDINQRVTKMVTIPAPEGSSVQPEQIEIVITPNFYTETSEESTAPVEQETTPSTTVEEENSTTTETTTTSTSQAPESEQETTMESAERERE